MSITHKIDGINDGADAGGIIGEIITWSCGEARKGTYRIDIDSVRAALDKVGLPRTLAKDLNHVDAMARALKFLKDKNLIRQTGSDKTHVYFQVNGISLLQNGTPINSTFDYRFQAILSLERSSGVIANPSGTPEGERLVPQAKVLFETAHRERSASDITRMVQKAVDAKKRSKKGQETVPVDLIPIRHTGGAYFVWADQLAYADKLEAFCNEVGATFERFPIAAGKRGTISVGKIVTDHLEKMVCELKEEIQSMDTDGKKSREDTRTNAVNRINELRMMLASRRRFLANTASDLESQIKDLDLEYAAALKRALAFKPEAKDDKEGTDDQEPSSAPAPAPVVKKSLFSDDDDDDDTDECEAPALVTASKASPSPRRPLFQDDDNDDE